MKVLEESTRGVSVGSVIALGDLGLPVEGAGGLLIVFWKER